MTLALLRFRAGGASLGVAAQAARGFAHASPEIIHVGSLLGLPVAPARQGDGRRAVELNGQAGRALVLVDGPVALHAIGPADILTRPPGLPAQASPLVLGFAAERGRIIMLLDVERLIAVAHERVSLQAARSPETAPRPRLPEAAEGRQS